ncbi:MAG: ArsR/SmtB family transcription factor [Gemmatimonadaceae bacterium]
MTTSTLPDIQRATRCFHALSDQTRLEILELLSTGERCVCELIEALDAAQSRLSFHLKALKEAGLVSDRREGRWVYYALNPAALDDAEALLESFARGSRNAGRRDSCCD